MTLDEQIVAELDRAIVGPVRNLLGLDIADQLTARVEAMAPVLAGQLIGDDRGIAADTVIDLMCALWPTGSPPAQWWATRLGQQIARSVGMDDAYAVTQADAAAMLGVTRGTIAQLVHRGTLDRHPDGGVLVASILDRIDR